MLEFKEVTYLYKVMTFVESIEEINTSEGYARLDRDKDYYWYPLLAPFEIPDTPWHFLKEDSTLYLMREEPNYYV